MMSRFRHAVMRRHRTRRDGSGGSWSQSFAQLHLRKLVVKVPPTIATDLGSHRITAAEHGSLCRRSRVLEASDHGRQLRQGRSQLRNAVVSLWSPSWVHARGSFL
jgi:hypothetical protein